MSGQSVFTGQIAKWMAGPGRAVCSSPSGLATQSVPIDAVSQGGSTAIPGPIPMDQYGGYASTWDELASAPRSMETGQGSMYLSFRLETQAWTSRARRSAMRWARSVHSLGMFDSQIGGCWSPRW